MSDAHLGFSASWSVSFGHPDAILVPDEALEGVFGDFRASLASLQVGVEAGWGAEQGFALGAPAHVGARPGDCGSVSGGSLGHVVPPSLPQVYHGG